MLNKIIAAICLLLLCVQAPCKAYTLKGNIGNVAACYYPRVYLEVIKDIGDVYTTRAENLITSADIDGVGNFILSGKELPKEKMYYRLYVTQSANVQNSIRTGWQRNYVVLLLDNSSDVTITIADICAHYFTYTVTGAENAAIASLQQILNSSQESFAKATTESRKQFLADSEYDELKHFADTCSYSLTGLLAVSEIGVETNHDKDEAFYTSFLKRLEDEHPTSVYTLQYKELLELSAIKQERKNHTIRWDSIALYALLICSVLLNIYFLFFKRKITPANLTAPEGPNEQKQVKELIETLSIKEREILMMVHKGLSNKEIANVQNIELSTVKTHVSRIYQKIGISSRKEVAAVAKYLDN